MLLRGWGLRSLDWRCHFVDVESDILAEAVGSNTQAQGGPAQHSSCFQGSSVDWLDLTREAGEEEEMILGNVEKNKNDSETTSIWTVMNVHFVKQK